MKPKKFTLVQYIELIQILPVIYTPFICEYGCVCVYVVLCLFIPCVTLCNHHYSQDTKLYDQRIIIEIPCVTAL